MLSSCPVKTKVSQAQSTALIFKFFTAKDKTNE